MRTIKSHRISWPRRIGAAIAIISAPFWSWTGKASTVSFVLDVISWVRRLDVTHWLTDWGWMLSVGAAAAILGWPWVSDWRRNRSAGNGRRRQSGDLRRSAEDLARRLYDFVDAQRNRRATLDDLLLPQVSPPNGPLIRFDPWPYARKEYEVQYAEKVAEIYARFFDGSLLAGPTTNGFGAALAKFTGKPAMPTTFNEIIAIALELQLKASKLPSD